MQVRLAAATGFTVDSSLAEVTLVDNDLPTVSILALDRQAGEDTFAGTNTAAFLVHREGNTDGLLPLFVARGGSAASGIDYQLVVFGPDGASSVLTPSDQLFLHPGSNSQVVLVRPLPDGDYEGAESVTLEFWPGSLDGIARVNTNAASATVTILDDDLPVVSFEADDLVATEYNLKPATVTLRRTGNTAGPLTVRLAISGSAAATNDFQLRTNGVAFTNGVVVFSSGASAVVLQIAPLSDPFEERAETVTLTIKGSLGFAIGSLNSVTILLDDESPTRFQIVQLKQSAANDRLGSQGPFESSSAVYELRRFGRSSLAAGVPFAFFVDQGGTMQRVFSVGVTGDLDGTQTNLVFAPWAFSARLRAIPPASQPVGAQFHAGFHTVISNFYPFTVRPISEIVTSLSLVQTNAIEGTTTRAVVRLERTYPHPAPASLSLFVQGAAVPSGLPLADHNFANPINLTIPAHATFVETNLAALTDSHSEGWESVVLTPDLSPLTAGLEPRPPLIAFLRENVADLSTLPESDLDLDGLGDHWEVAHGFDPLTPGEPDLDGDRDGLINFEEQQANTNPHQVDSDGDGANDFMETAQISNPLDPGDGGQPPPPGEFLELRLRLGDHSGSHSERYRVDIGSKNFINRVHGVVEEFTLNLRRGQSYPIRLRHLSTTLPQPDHDYHVEVLPEPTTSPAGFVIDDPQGLMGQHDNDPTYPTKTATLIVPTIEVVLEEANDNLPLDANPGPGGGLRVYPDQHSPTDIVDRRRIAVIIKTTPPVPGRQVRLRSIDVDDPTPIDNDPSFIIDSMDRFGPLGDDNRGLPPAGQLLDTVLTLDEFGQALTLFTVSLQPGDNYRIAAVLDGPGAEIHLNELQVLLPYNSYYVSPDTNAVSAFIGGISPMLTVWRKLHLEFDSMAALPTSGPEATYIDGVLISVTPNWPSAGKSLAKVRHAIGSGPPDVYQNGKLQISGSGTYRISRSETKLLSGQGEFLTALQIDAVPGNAAVGATVKLYDDDNQYLANEPLYPSLLNLPAPLPITDSHLNQIVPLLQSAYRPAYIEVTSANAAGWNSTSIIPFRRNQSALELNILGQQISYFDQGNLNLKGKDRPEFWAFSVVYGYQPSPSEDGDDNGESPLEGGTPKRRLIDGNRGQALGYSVIFVESVRDRAFLNWPPESFVDPNPIIQNRLLLDYWSRLGGQSGHEVGHSPGRQSEAADHGELGLMVKGGNFYPGETANLLQRFKPESIKRFRATSQWSD